MKSPGSSSPRDSAGRFVDHASCEACRKPVRGEYMSDDDTCNAHGVGLILCDRARCGKARGAMTISERLALYTRPA